VKDLNLVEKNRFFAALRMTKRDFGSFSTASLRGAEVFIPAIKVWFVLQPGNPVVKERRGERREAKRGQGNIFGV
jgi:hypothetical protein